ncbi:MAG TPA: hypothetical protein VL240_14365, partial [Candidatus Binatia bacterium]|nr:hypothetical protein [Candidatus Binatia bacterium]
YVKVKLQNHAELEGQLRDITDSNFSVQVLKGSAIETVAVAYEDMKGLSVSGHSSGGGKVAKSVIFSAI